MNKIVCVGKAKDWKDRMAGWAKWKIFCPECKTCGKKDVFYTVQGTRADAEKFASNPEMNACSKCG